MKKHTLLALLFSTIFCVSNLYAQPPAGQTGGGIDKQEADLAKQRTLIKQITTERKKAEEAEPIERALPAEEGKKVLVKSIDVQGSTLVPKTAIDKIVAPYIGSELGLAEMQKICDLITAEYRTKGYMTSRAYLPPQSIKDGALTIIIVEGKLGTVEVKGNHYFSAAQIKKKVRMKSGDFFDYQSLQKSLVKINEHPDRFVKSVLVPGKEPGTTDVILEVEDRLPIHVGYEYDNFGSRYINYDRHTITVEDNNLFGQDDTFLFRYQKGQNQFYDMTYLRYSIPVVDRIDAGVYWLWSGTKLGKEYKAEDVKGKSEIGGPFVSITLFTNDTIDLRANVGFDYKHIENYISGVKTSRDETRVIKAGFDLDVTDRWGRTILTLEEDVGIAGCGLHKKDPLATRPGAGAEFGKLIGNLYRLQPMPFGSSILWKNSFQATNYNMLAVEQFQLGGISNVRAYSPAEYSGDQGLSSTVEWSFPLYGMPKTIKVPYSKATVYDATRFVLFYDMGYVHLNNPQSNEKENKTIQGWGMGFRVNLPEDCFVRLEASYRIDRHAMFDSANGYIDVGKKF